MTTFASLQTKVYTYTNRPDLATETLAALKQAVRTAHKSGKYWKDLTTQTVSGLSTTSLPQTIDLSALSRPRAIAAVTPSGLAGSLDPIGLDDVIDVDGYTRTNVYWGLGNTLKVNPAESYSSYVITYYQWPLMDDTNVTSWIVDSYEDLILLWAASTVLGMIGEQEIKGRLEQLAVVELQDLQQDNLEVYGR